MYNALKKNKFLISKVTEVMKIYKDIIKKQWQSVSVNIIWKGQNRIVR